MAAAPYEATSGIAGPVNDLQTNEDRYSRFSTSMRSRRGKKHRMG